MTESQEVELWPCDYSAACLAPRCRRRAAMILRYLDDEGQLYRQTELCETHARELCVEMRVIDRWRSEQTGFPFFKSKRKSQNKKRETVCAQ
jgi:hypothetical protein